MGQGEPAWLENAKNEEDMQSTYPVHNGGHIHVDNDESLAQERGEELKQEFLDSERKQRAKENQYLFRSTRLTCDTKEQGR